MIQRLLFLVAGIIAVIGMMGLSLSIMIYDLPNLNEGSNLYVKLSWLCVMCVVIAIRNVIMVVEQFKEQRGS